MKYLKTIYLVFLLLFFLFPEDNFASQPDSGLVGKERSIKINEYLNLAKIKLRIDTNAAIKAALSAKRLSQGFAKDKVIKANIIIAQSFQLKGNLDSALLILKEAFIQSETVQNDTILAEIHHTFGVNYQYAGTFELAIEHYHRAIKINESLGMMEETTKQLNNIGLIYREQKEYDTALIYLEKCIKVSKEYELKELDAYTNANIGYVLMKQKKWDEALEKLEQSLELDQQINDTLYHCTLNYLISDVKLNQKKYQDAKVFAKKALQIAENVDFALGKIFSQRVLSEVYLKENKYSEARDMIGKTLAYLKKHSAYLYLEDVLNVYYQIEYETKNYKKALTIQNQLYARRDSLNEVETKEKIANSEYKYQLLKKEKEKQLLIIQNESSQKNSFLAITVALLLLLLVCLALFFYRNSKNHNKTLEQAIKERTKELESSNEELERFAFIASHDLKTPLRSIVSFTNLLERQLRGYENEQVHEYLGFIKNGGTRLNNLITDTLNYSKLSSNKKDNKPDSIVNLNTVLKEVINASLVYFEEKKAKILKINNLPIIMADHSSMSLLFQNFIENGIKYNESENPTIEISSKKEVDFLSIFVKDNGIGIPPAYNEKVFVMFSRLHNQDKYEGSGLGLSICKKIVDGLGGQILIQSEIGKGSVFEIRLPLNIIAKETAELSSITKN